MITKEDKELLLKDLCARLPYGVKVQVDSKHWCDFNSSIPSKLTFENSYRLLFVGTNLGYVKPYLFPLSSMTEEQLKDVKSVLHQEIIDIYENCSEERKVPEYPQTWYYVQNWYNAHHFDYQGLIEKGLAIDATGLNIY